MRLAYFSQWSGPLYPDGLCWSSGCIVEAVRMFYAYKCRLTFLEAGRIWGRVMCIRMGWSGWYACYVSLWGVWHVFSGGGVPTRASDAMRAEVMQVRADIQQLTATQQELTSQAERLSQDLNRANLDLQQVATCPTPLFSCTLS